MYLINDVNRLTQEIRHLVPIIYRGGTSMNGIFREFLVLKNMFILGSRYIILNFNNKFKKLIIIEIFSF